MSRKKTWRSVSIPTVRSLRRNSRVLDRKIRNIELALDYMRAGAKLCLTYGKAGPTWTLSVGGKVDSQIAKLIIARDDIYSVGGALFADCLAQAYRHVN
jgi:hypothetical protein